MEQVQRIRPRESEDAFAVLGLIFIDTSCWLSADFCWFAGLLAAWHTFCIFYEFVSMSFVQRAFCSSLQLFA